MNHSLSFNKLELQATNHLLENSLERWNLFMKSKDNWLFNFYSDDDQPLNTRWKNLDSFQAALVTKGNMLVQINRSATEAKLKNSNVWARKDTLNMDI